LPVPPKSKLGICDYCIVHEGRRRKTTVYMCEHCGEYFCQEHQNPKEPHPAHSGKRSVVEDWRANGHPCLPYVDYLKTMKKDGLEKQRKAMDRMVTRKPQQEIPVESPRVPYPQPDRTIPTKWPPSIERVRRRDGKIVDFDKGKIKYTIFKRVRNWSVAEELSDEVVRILEQRYAGQMPTLLDVHKIVEMVLTDWRHSAKVEKRGRNVKAVRTITEIIAILVVGTILAVLAVNYFPKNFSIPTPSNVPLSINNSELEKEVFGLINQERQNQGMPPLVWDNLLSEIARAHSRNMAENHFFSHQSPQGWDLTVRLDGISYSTAGEVILMQDRILVFPIPKTQSMMASDTVDGWMNSPGHRMIILGGYSEIGVGVWNDLTTYYFTADLIG
jgi:uncharacterized protein YkwD